MVAHVWFACPWSGSFMSLMENTVPRKKKGLPMVCCRCSCAASALKLCPVWFPAPRTRSSPPERTAGHPEPHWLRSEDPPGVEILLSYSFIFLTLGCLFIKPDWYLSDPHGFMQTFPNISCLPVLWVGIVNEIGKKRYHCGINSSVRFCVRVCARACTFVSVNKYKYIEHI